MGSLAHVVLAVSVATASAWAGCALYDASLLGYGDAGRTDGGGDAAVACQRARWPDRPPKETSNSVADFYVALKSIDFGANDGGAPLPTGFDLDGLCTCPEVGSCKPANLGKTQCDLARGTDNGAPATFALFSQMPGLWNPRVVNDRLSKGTTGGLIRVRRYNGLADDSDVEVSYFSSNGTEGVQTGTPRVPLGDGTDKWTIDPDSLLGGKVPGDGGTPVPISVVDVSAYVAGHTLVAHLDIPVPWAIGDATETLKMAMSGGLLVATLRPGNGKPTVMDDAVIVGRWPTTKLLTALAAAHDPLAAKNSLCGSDPVYLGLRTGICALADLPTNVTDDRKNAGCDAISVGIAFTTVPATFGSAFQLGDGGVNTCGAQWMDTCPP